MEKVRYIARQNWIAREQPQVSIEPCRLDMIIASPNVGVGSQPVCFLPNDHRDFAVGLKSHDTVDNMRASAFQLLRPVQVASLVKASRDFNDAGNLFSALGGAN